MKILSVIAAVALGLIANEAAAQKNLKEQIVGTWEFVVAEVTAPDGKKSFPFGETPKGIKAAILRALPFWSYREWRFWRAAVPECESLAPTRVTTRRQRSQHGR